MSNDNEKTRMKKGSYYLTSYFPFLIILLFSVSFSLFMQKWFIAKLTEMALYDSITELLPAGQFKFLLVLGLVIVFFMIFSTFKVLGETFFKLSLLFFAKDDNGVTLQYLQKGTWILLSFAGLSVLTSNWITITVCVFLLGILSYFVYFIFQLTDSMPTMSIVGIILFNMFFWFMIILSVVFLGIKVYNQFMSIIA